MITTTIYILWQSNFPALNRLWSNNHILLYDCCPLNFAEKNAVQNVPIFSVERHVMNWKLIATKLGKLYFAMKLQEKLQIGTKSNFVEMGTYLCCHTFLSYLVRYNYYIFSKNVLLKKNCSCTTSTILLYLCGLHYYNYYIRWKKIWVKSNKMLHSARVLLVNKTISLSLTFCSSL